MYRLITDQHSPPRLQGEEVTMAKSKLKPLVNYAKYDALGAQLLGYEIAISSFFEVLARTDTPPQKQ